MDISLQKDVVVLETATMVNFKDQIENIKLLSAK